MKKIYIAGPDVFEKNSLEIGKEYVALCKKYGFLGLYPLDNVVDFSQEKHKIAQDIYEANVAMIDSADIIIANLSSFRGKESDSGTIWECGYAFARGKKVFGYLDREGNYIDQFDMLSFDKKGRFIEDFDYPVNLMIASSCDAILYGSFEDVLKLLADHNL